MDISSRKTDAYLNATMYQTPSEKRLRTIALSHSRLRAVVRDAMNGLKSSDSCDMVREEYMSVINVGGGKNDK